MYNSYQPMMISIPFILLGFVLFLLAVEMGVVRRLIRRIPIRVHVNGSRGKSSVTRYIAAGLRAGGKRVLSKITGVEPTIVLPDGNKEIIKRRGPANVREQIKLTRLANKLSCDALVLECMSIAPALQRLETALLKPHVTVLTNILEDHLEELGNTDAERTEAYCSSLPSHAVVVTADTEHIWEIEDAASQRNSRVIIPGKHEINLNDERLSPIAIEHAGLALNVCKILGVDEQEALQGILQELRDEESLLYTFPLDERKAHFVNGFAVNDVFSASVFLETWKQRLDVQGELIFILNTRSDRPRRSLEFARWCSTLKELKAIILTGTHIPLTRRMLLRFGVPGQRVTTWTSRQAQHPQAGLLETGGKETVIFGFGNIAGDGFLLLDALKPFQQRMEASHDY